MPTIYGPIGAEGFELCHPTNDDFENLNTLIDGTPRQVGWRPIPMRLIRCDEDEPLVESDSPWLGSHALLFRRRAVAGMGDLLTNAGELLPVDCPEAELFLFNPPKILDALDERASTLQRFSSGAIMRITRHVFRPERIAGVDAFRIANLRVSPTFVSERMVETWRAADLRGLDFKAVWTG